MTKPSAITCPRVSVMRSAPLLPLGPDMRTVAAALHPPRKGKGICYLSMPLHRLHGPAPARWAHLGERIAEPRAVAEEEGQDEIVRRHRRICHMPFSKCRHVSQAT